MKVGKQMAVKKEIQKSSELKFDGKTYQTYL